MLVLNFFEGKKEKVMRLKYAAGVGLAVGLLAVSVSFAAQPDPAAQAAYDKKDYKTSVQLLEDQLKKNPNDADVMVLLGSAYRQLGDAAKSEEVLKKAAGLKGKDPQVLLKYGHTLLAAKKFKEAEEVFQKGVATNKRTDEFYNGLGLAQFGQGAGNKAELSFRQAIQKNPNVAAYHKNLGDVNMASQIYTIAASSYKNALKLDSSNAEMRHLLARAYILNKNYNEAVAELQIVLKLDPTYAKAYQDLGKLYIFSAKNAGDSTHYQKAVEALSKYTQLDPKNAEAYLDLARAQIAVKNAEAAREAARQALAIDSTLCDAYFIAGQALQDTKKDSASLFAVLEDYNQYEACLGRKSPPYSPSAKDYEFFIRRGRANRALSDSAHYARALADFNKVLELLPNNTAILLDIGLTHYYLKNYPAADSAFSKRLAADSTSPAAVNVYFYHGYVLSQLERHSEAAHAFERVTVLKPDFLGGWKQLGEARMRLKDYPGALEAYNQVLTKDPDDVDASKYVGFVYLDQGKHSQALPYLERAWKQVTGRGFKVCEQVDLLTYLAQTYMALKSNSRAKEYFQRCVDCEPGNNTCKEGLDYLKGIKGELSSDGDGG
ncbi:MAG: tetratricopeptide repeat protein [candidate division Zixibacteria bacterium]|nr:tetratricopeptide repeat protein [candidate division Zixibacteria bacterium]MCI0596652.1 tetratricopeptide repeat protein [candidate division Zixibacteria bacterium]